MGVMKVVLPDELEEKFREEIFKTKGMKKGNLSESAAEAVEMWLKESKEKRKEMKKEKKANKGEEYTEETPKEEESWNL